MTDKIFYNSYPSIIWSETAFTSLFDSKGWGKEVIYALKWVYSEIHVTIREMVVGYFSLGNLGLPYQISGQKKLS